MRNKPTFCLLLLGLFFVATTSAQQKQANSKYALAYQQYEQATCPLAHDEIKHFVYFSRNREQIRQHPFLAKQRIAGAQIMYAWRQLEPQKGNYDFSLIQEDYAYLLSKGKKLFIQLQDVTFSASYKAVPDYLLTDKYDGGCFASAEEEGWVSIRWNKNVQARWALLLAELGKEFDGKIEGINLQETAISMNEGGEKQFSPERYVQCIKENMKALKQAFPTSVCMQYANFMPSEWLPWEDKGYLKSIYQYGEEIGVGLGGPDLMVQRTGQLNHLITIMHENAFTVPLGIAIQDGNYVGKTGADHDYNESEDKGAKGQKKMVPLLHAFAKDFLKVNYMFWVNQEPYIYEDVLPCLSSH